ncbi:uncharacterized protein FA14DRAFT_188317 [Meira miltonrushii]|uniref:Uncharacterized protein n=1 Tax=Meira miltonrushii TaxID=1280837 RepID=A0A316VL06_9BASI|nr:uncharacterized protein FA14DRAFT_188317 [Meira miltonrushii]PWN38309.1 hypothetical protein FA14DRAFT_188317 [Meira miltonrushii]
MINDLLAENAKGTKDSTDKAAVLPPEDLAQILTSIQTILQLYATNEEEDIDLGKEDEQAIKHIADYLRLPLATLGDENSTRIQNALPDCVRLGLRLRPWRGTGSSKAIEDQSLYLETSFNVRKTGQASEDMLWPMWKLHKATWLVDEKYSELVEAGNRAAKEYKTRMKEDKDEGQMTASYVLNIAEAITETALEQE